MRKNTEKFLGLHVDGKICTILCYQDVIRTDTLDGPGTEMLGLKSYMLSNGRTLNTKDGANFVDVNSGEKITRQ
jgi:hypothetical protein